MITDARQLWIRITTWAVITIAAAAAFFCLACTDVSAETGSVTATGWNVNGTSFRLYYIASLDSDMSGFTTVNDLYRDEVKTIPVDSSTHAEEWTAAASDLYKIIKNNHVNADRTAAAYGGRVSFAGLTPGLYLLDGDPARSGGKTYTPAATLISVPNRVSTSDSWNYNVTSDIKMTIKEDGKPVNPPEETKTKTSKTNNIKTGDSTALPVYVCLLAAAAIILSAAAVYMKKRAENKRG